jgi:mRNA interferase MazF
MRRGEIWWADLEPVRGSEANKTRPVLLVSNDGANQKAQKLGRGFLSVVPLTSNVGRVLPFQVRLASDTTGLPHDSKAQAEQIRSLDVRRLTRWAGHIDSAAMTRVDNALRLHLAL